MNADKNEANTQYIDDIFTLEGYLHHICDLHKNLRSRTLTSSKDGPTQDCGEVSLEPRPVQLHSLPHGGRPGHVTQVQLHQILNI
jgi:hypothetical protein